MIGQSVAHYRITEKLGEGGMGEVYLARDTKLNRDVALKILPQVFAQDSERMARFEREAQVLASLNHANIAQIHGLEETDGTKALVLELVEGETLQEQIARGPIPVDEALKIALQICEGLEAAHEKGIIHRDLKPANIKITPEGQVKILDFGLAKAMEDPVSRLQSPVSGLSHSPTLTQQSTQAGVILGTAAYMSPEQTRGRPVDKRADIWAFGCVLYEMLTGKKAFEGDSLTDVLAAIVRERPDWNQLPSGTSLRVCELIDRCLNQETWERLRDIGDARIEIIKSQNRSESAFGLGKNSPQSGTRSRLPWLLNILWAAVAIFFAAMSISKDSRTLIPPVSSRLSISLPEDAPLAPSASLPHGIGRPALAISPNGKTLVYVALVGGRTHLYKHDMPTGETRPIPGTEEGRNPFFSPDSEWIGFFAGEKLKKTNLRGGEPQFLADASDLEGGATWSEDGSIYFIPWEGAGVSAVADSGGEVRTIAEPKLDGAFVVLNPAPLPQGEHLLVSWGFWGGISAITAGGSVEGRFLAEQGGHPLYLPTGHLLFVEPGKLVAARFDPVELSLRDSPVTVLEDLRTETMYGGQYTVSNEGTLVYAAGQHMGLGTPVWVDHEGRREVLEHLERAWYGQISLSPDGSHLAYPLYDSGSWDIWICDLSRGTKSRLTHGRNNQWPVWDRSGAGVVFSDLSGASSTLLWRAGDGSAPSHQISTGNHFPIIPREFDPEGNLLFTQLSLETDFDLWLLPMALESSRSSVSIGPQRLLATVHAENFTSLSHDGRWLAYSADDTGRSEIYVRPYPDLQEVIPISTSGGGEPLWSPDGRALFYNYGPHWFVVDIETEPEFQADRPRLLFEGPFLNLAGRSYDVAPDGTRLLVVENQAAGQTQSELVVVTNFFEELKRLVPTE